MSSPVSPTYDCYDSDGVAVASRLLDLAEPPDYSTTFGTTTVYSRRAGVPLINPTTLPIFDTNTNWAIGLARFQGMLWGEASSLAATVKTRFTSRWQFPIGADMANAPAASRVPLRHQLEVVIFRTTPVVAVAPLSFGVLNNANARELSDTAVAGYEVVSRSDVNAGRWTVRARFSNGGALQTIQDTGIDPATTPQIHAALRYEHALTPRLSCYINGVEYGVISGQSSMPVMGTSLQTIGLAQGLSAGGGVGQIDRSRQTRVWIEEIV